MATKKCKTCDKAHVARECPFEGAELRAIEIDGRKFTAAIKTLDDGGVQVAVPGINIEPVVEDSEEAAIAVMRGDLVQWALSSQNGRASMEVEVNGERGEFVLNGTTGGPQESFDLPPPDPMDLLRELADADAEVDRAEEALKPYAERLKAAKAMREAVTERMVEAYHQMREPRLFEAAAPAGETEEAVPA